MKILPNGVSNYEELVKYNCYYVDKTEYIEKLENLSNRRVMFLRPRRFGKTLFTSILENYYDINKKDKFEELFGETYIGKNPTSLKNSYYILYFNFSGVNTDTREKVVENFYDEVKRGIRNFVNKYNIDFSIDKYSTVQAMQKNFFDDFKLQKSDGKIYIIIDEYDQFTNELLGYDTEHFKHLIDRNGEVRSWYETLKIGNQIVVDRMFITGVAPITLDSLTSGFNIASNITLDEFFNEMMGFTEEELIQIMDSQELSRESQEYILPIMKEYYNGYKFSKYSETKIYNSTMCLYFLDYYLKHKRLPDKMTDVNVDSDSSKIKNILNLCSETERYEVIKDSLANEKVETKITEKFNPMIQTTIDDMFSMLFYMGYLTIEEKDGELDILTIPNKVMKGLYQEYCYSLLNNELDNAIINNQREIQREISEEGKIEKTTRNSTPMLK